MTPVLVAFPLLQDPDWDLASGVRMSPSTAGDVDGMRLGVRGAWPRFALQVQLYGALANRQYDAWDQFTEWDLPTTPSRTPGGYSGQRVRNDVFAVQLLVDRHWLGATQSGVWEAGPRLYAGVEGARVEEVFDLRPSSWFHIAGTSPYADYGGLEFRAGLGLVAGVSLDVVGYERVGVRLGWEYRAWMEPEFDYLTQTETSSVLRLNPTGTADLVLRLARDQNP